MTTAEFAKGDVVQLTGGRDPNSSVVRAVSSCKGAVQLETPLGGYYNWNAFDVEHVPQPGEHSG